MKANPILQEVWRIKDELAREAGYDINRYCEQLRAWSATFPHPGPIVSSPEELRRLLAETNPTRVEESALALNAGPSRKD